MSGMAGTRLRRPVIPFSVSGIPKTSQLDKPCFLLPAGSLDQRLVFVDFFDKASQQSSATDPFFLRQAYMDSRLVNIGFGNAVKVGRILAVVNPGSSPIRKLKEEARLEKKLIDVTEGRRTRAIIVLDSGHLVLSSVQPETISQRLLAMDLDQRNPKQMLSKTKQEEHHE